jgi:GNAT superfamily N-acetyltransferase
LGVVEAIYVEPQARAVGVGEALMDTALDWFRRRGCAGVDAVALPGARLTKNFFEEFGFTSRLLVMHHRFDHDAAEEPGADQA